MNLPKTSKPGEIPNEEYLLRDADIPNLSEILKDNYYKDKNI